MHAYNLTFTPNPPFRFRCLAGHHTVQQIRPVLLTLAVPQLEPRFRYRRWRLTCLLPQVRAMLLRAPRAVVMCVRAPGPLLRRVQVDAAHLRRAALHPRCVVQVEGVRARPRKDVVQGNGGEYEEFGIFGGFCGHLPECVSPVLCYFVVEAALLKLTSPPRQRCTATSTNYIKSSP